ncbi:MAG: MerR family transcriptional regulator [Anaerolineae bacterium]|nr:MerR family transcriptional regulator [Anaerolineae bacterium]
MLWNTERSMDYFTLQEVVVRSGLSEHTLRYYERIGLLEQVERDHSSGHRRYTAEDLQVIEVMACLRATGMSIDNMRRFIELARQGQAAELAELFEAHRQQLEIELARKQEHLRYLGMKVEFWKAASAGDDVKMREIRAASDALAIHLMK